MREEIIPFSFQGNLQTGEINGYWSNSYYEFEHQGKIYRHYCLEKRTYKKSGLVDCSIGYNAIVRQFGNEFKGFIMSDEYYNQEKIKKEDIAELIENKYNIPPNLNLKDFEQVMVIKKGSAVISPKSKETLIYYNTHGEFYSLKEFYEIEIKQRNNYSIEELLEWMIKYSLTPEARVIWVTPKIEVALSYEPGIKKKNLIEYSSEDGNIIVESNDGNDGYLFYYYEEYRLQYEKWQNIEKSKIKEQFKTLDQFSKWETNLFKLAKSEDLNLDTDDIKGILEYFKELFKSDIEKLSEDRPKVSFEDIKKR
ncbi:MAG: hypothetical protein ACFFDB_00405 [Promethearchaeota archaeon]